MNRTNQQNRALHKWCGMLAEKLDEGGLDMREFIKIPIRPNKDNIKAEIVHPVMKAINPELTSTAEMTTSEVTEVVDTINRGLGERLGIYMPFPTNT